MTELTRNQKLVLETLQNAPHQMSAYEILDRLRSQGLKAPPQIYRALDKLIEARLVHKLESLNAFVSCRHDDCHDSALTAFMICDNCGDVKEFGADTADSVAGVLARQTGKQGFVPSQTAIEIKGTCARCH